jgi:hypothetical protein
MVSLSEQINNQIKQLNKEIDKLIKTIKEMSEDRLIALGAIILGIILIIIAIIIW